MTTEWIAEQPRRLKRADFFWKAIAFVIGAAGLIAMASFFSGCKHVAAQDSPACFQVQIKTSRNDETPHEKARRLEREDDFGEGPRHRKKP